MNHRSKGAPRIFVSLNSYSVYRTLDFYPVAWRTRGNGLDPSSDRRYLAQLPSVLTFRIQLLHLIIPSCIQLLRARILLSSYLKTPESSTGFLLCFLEKKLFCMLHTGTDHRYSCLEPMRNLKLFSVSSPTPWVALLFVQVLKRILEVGNLKRNCLEPGICVAMARDILNNKGRQELS